MGEIFFLHFANKKGGSLPCGGYPFGFPVDPSRDQQEEPSSWASNPPNPEDFASLFSPFELVGLQDSNLNYPGAGPALQPDFLIPLSNVDGAYYPPEGLVNHDAVVANSHNDPLNEPSGAMHDAISQVEPMRGPSWNGFGMPQSVNPTPIVAASGTDVLNVSPHNVGRIGKATLGSESDRESSRYVRNPL